VWDAKISRVVFTVLYFLVSTFPMYSILPEGPVYIYYYNAVSFCSLIIPKYIYPLCTYTNTKD